MTVVLVVGILVFLIVVHEFGHFVAAKIFRVRVDEFGVGYPPRAFLLGKIGETEYTLNWIPFGGFVRLFGENEEAPGKRDSFSSVSRSAQAVILVAGVTMNVIAAWLLFAGALAIGIPHSVAPGSADPATHLMVTSVVRESPAATAGLQPGDEIVAVRSGEESAELTPPSIVSFVGARGGEEIEITYRRRDQEYTATLYPAHAIVPSAKSRPAVGIGLDLVTASPLPLREALAAAGPVTLDKFWSVITGFGTMIANVFRGASILEEVVGPVGLVGVVGVAAQHGLASVFVLAGFISLNLAVVNLIPIPALDGGRLVLLGVEALMRRSASRLAVQLLNTFGISLIAVLMIAVTYNDIVRLLA